MIQHAWVKKWLVISLILSVLVVPIYLSWLYIPVFMPQQTLKYSPFLDQKIMALSICGGTIPFQIDGKAKLAFLRQSRHPDMRVRAGVTMFLAMYAKQHDEYAIKRLQEMTHDKIQLVRNCASLELDDVK